MCNEGVTGINILRKCMQVNVYKSDLSESGWVEVSWIISLLLESQS